MANDEIYDSMIQKKGLAYHDGQILDSDRTHYREPIDNSPGRLAGNSRAWGDASPEVQSRSVDALIQASQRGGLSQRQTAYVLAMARVESGFNPDAAAGTTTAFGLGQFIDATGKGYGITSSNRGDITKQAEALVATYKDDAALAKKMAKVTSISTNIIMTDQSGTMVDLIYLNSMLCHLLETMKSSLKGMRRLMLSCRLTLTLINVTRQLSVNRFASIQLITL